MDLYEEPPVRSRDEDLFFSVTRVAFEQRRKTLVNALGGNPNVPCSKEAVKEALEKMGKSPTVRGEALSLEEFARLCDLMT
jgi:16S rRNA (adenine1518-N6/adenine1519-N6)-dimethyltransferase